MTILVLGTELHKCITRPSWQSKPAHRLASKALYGGVLLITTSSRDSHRLEGQGVPRRKPRDQAGCTLFFSSEPLFRILGVVWGMMTY